MGPPKESGAEAAGSNTSLANLLILLRPGAKVKQPCVREPLIRSAAIGPSGAETAN